jgi:hypothetical protein
MDRWESSVATLADWVRAGRLRYEEDILDGPEACPMRSPALVGLLLRREPWQAPHPDLKASIRSARPNVALLALSCKEC